MIHNLPTIFLPGEFHLTPGTAADYHALARFHYAPGPPATFAAVVCVRWKPFEAGYSDRAANAGLTDDRNLPRRGASRGSKRGKGPTSRGMNASPFARSIASDPSALPVRSAACAAAWQSQNEQWSSTIDSVAPTSSLIGVLVLSYPSALNRARHRVFGLRPLRFGHRLRWVNANLRTISRVIIHPQFRGLGLSTTLIRAAMDRCPTPLIEASARMGRAHPLFDRVGFHRVVPTTDDEPIYYWRHCDPLPARLFGNLASAGPHSPARVQPVPRVQHSTEADPP